MKKKILVLGADGFIGSNLVKKLLTNTAVQVVAFDLFRGGVSKNLAPMENLKMMPGNFLSREDIRLSLKGVDYVFHFVSLTTPGSSMNDPLIDVETNLKGTIVLLEECFKAKVRRVIFSSSGGAIYGSREQDMFSEEDRLDPISPYAISKLAIERYFEYYRINRGLDYLILRYANPYGPGQNLVGSQGIIPIFLNLMKMNSQIRIFGDGENLRDYIYIDDLVDLTLKLYDKKNIYRVYNIGSGNSISINNVVSILKKVTGMKVGLKRLPSRSIDVRKIVLDISRLKQEIDCKKMTELEDGIKKTWDWIISSKKN